jgi:hypothetical protein
MSEFFDTISFVQSWQGFMLLFAIWLLWRINKALDTINTNIWNVRIMLYWHMGDENVSKFRDWKKKNFDSGDA